MNLEQYRQQFSQRRFLAMPLAGMMVWLGIFAISLFASEATKVWSVWIGTGSIIYLGIGLSKLTGEDFLAQNKHKNPFDRLFLVSVTMCLLVFSLAMPMASLDYTTIPMSVGILAGLMWMPLSWIIGHWVGYLHAIVRTIGCTALWYMAPEQSFTLISLWIVVIYAITIVVLHVRFQTISALTHTSGNAEVQCEKEQSK